MNQLKGVAERKWIGSPVFTEGEYHAAIIVVHEPQYPKALSYSAQPQRGCSIQPSVGRRSRPTLGNDVKWRTTLKGLQQFSGMLMQSLQG